MPHTIKQTLKIQTSKIVVKIAHKSRKPTLFIIFNIISLNHFIG